MVERGLLFNEDLGVKFLRCPYCKSTLKYKDNVMFCKKEDKLFNIENNIVKLIKLQNMKEFRDFTTQYTEKRLKQGWKPLNSNQFRNFPLKYVKGYPRVFFEVQKENYNYIIRMLKDKYTKACNIADLGAGTGWLSYQLALRGHFVVGIDINVNSNFGLNPSSDTVYKRLILAQGDFNDPPLSSRMFDLVIFNASLHFSKNIDIPINSASNLLTHGGSIIICNSPMSLNSEKNVNNDSFILNKKLLEFSFYKANLKPSWVKINYGIYWRIHKIRSKVDRRVDYEFPFIIATL